MKILSSDSLMSGTYVYRIDRRFFNEFINYLGGCSEYFGTTSDETDSDEEKVMYHQHAIDIRALQSGILSRAVLDQRAVLFRITEEEQSALLYNLISMTKPLPESVEPHLPEEPSLFSREDGYFTYPLPGSQFCQVTRSLSGLVRDLNLILDSLELETREVQQIYSSMEDKRDTLIDLQANLEKFSYLFQDAETGRITTAMVVPQSQMMDLFRALLSVTTIEYGKTDFAGTLPQK